MDQFRKLFVIIIFLIGVYGFVTRDADGKIGGRGYVEALERSKAAVSVEQTPCSDGDLRVDSPANVTRRCSGNQWFRLSWDDTRRVVLDGRELPSYVIASADADLDKLPPDVGGGLKMSIYKSAYRWRISSRGEPLDVAIRHRALDSEAEVIEFSKRRYGGKRTVVDGVVFSLSSDVTYADGPLFSLGVGGEDHFIIAKELATVFSRG
jgi:hypothetical protein